ncbi:MAG: hypothetical protein MZW92_07610 [Comamonadaceae bacterium]|nr:hypothetical protein [Comamonadaceae bacterium]
MDARSVGNDGARLWPRVVADRVGGFGQEDEAAGAACCDAVRSSVIPAQVPVGGGPAPRRAPGTDGPLLLRSRAERQWCPPVVPAHVLTDRANRLSLLLQHEGDSPGEAVMSGCPLRVHRRCLHPAFPDTSAAGAEGHWVPTRGDLRRNGRLSVRGPLRVRRAQVVSPSATQCRLLDPLSRRT